MTGKIMPAWLRAPASVILEADEVHLWRAPLVQTAAIVRHTVSPSECTRAERFRFDKDRERFIAGRGLLRMILARYLADEGAALQFNVGAHGKPTLARPNNSLRFNLSHSGDLLLLAVMEAREVGVDIELMRPDVPFASVAQHCLAPEEASQIALLPDSEKACRFYELWTSTEARVKASGVGLVGASKLIEPDRWSLLTLTPAAGYAAALAVEGSDFELTCWSWRN